MSVKKSDANWQETRLTDYVPVSYVYFYFLNIFLDRRLHGTVIHEVLSNYAYYWLIHCTWVSSDGGRVTLGITNDLLYMYVCGSSGVS